MFMFTAGQVARMQACLDGPRSSIGTAAGGGTARPSSSPVVSWGANRIDAFVLGTDRALYHKWWNGSAWGPRSPDMRRWAASAPACRRRSHGARTVSTCSSPAPTARSITNGGTARHGGLPHRLREHGRRLRRRSARRSPGVPTGSTCSCSAPTARCTTNGGMARPGGPRSPATSAWAASA